MSIYDRILLVYPRAFRNRFAGDMRETFTRAGREARRKGLVHLLRFWIATLYEVTVFAAAEWIDLVRARLRPSSRSHGPLLPSSGASRDSRKLRLTIVHDLRYAVRALLRRPSFAITAVATLGLGIGANTAVFSVVHGIMWRPLSYQEPEELVAVWPNRATSLREAQFLRENSTTMSDVATVAGWAVGLTGVQNPTQLRAARVSANLFRLLGTPAALGRTFEPEEEYVGAAPAALLSHALWMNRFGADSSIVGRALTIDGQSHTVVGVMPASFEILNPSTQLWIPIIQDPEAWWFASNVSQMVARLAPGAGIAAANQEFQLLLGQMRETFGFPNSYGAGATVVNFKERLVGEYRTMFFVLLGAVGFILLIAGSNLGSLLLAKATDRRHEMAMRAALGATRGRLVQLVLAEGLLLGVAGGVMGLALAFGGVSLLRALVPADTPRLGGVAVDGPVLLACAVFALGTGLFFTIAPALAMARVDLQRNMNSSRSTSHSDLRQSRARQGFVMLQVALAVMLVVGASLMIQTTRRLAMVDPGFDFQRVLTLRLAPTGARYDTPAEYRRLYVDLLERVEALPEVQAAGAIQHLPFSGWQWGTTVEIAGQPILEGATPPRVAYRIVTVGYRESMSIPLVEGRWFLPSDDAASTPVAVVNRTMARRFWSGESAVRKRLLQGRGSSTWITIVGVIEDTHHDALDADPAPELYRPHKQSTMPQMMLAVRTAGDPAAIARMVQDAVWAMDSDLPISEVAPLRDLITSSMGGPRMIMILLTTFALVASILGGIGVYGVTAFWVGRRTNEIGIRMALGANRRRIMRDVLRQGMVHSLVGIALGLAGAVFLTRFLAGLVFGISTTDPGTFVAVVIFISLVSAGATYAPARRATNVDPASALRDT